MSIGQQQEAHVGPGGIVTQVNGNDNTVNIFVGAQRLRLFQPVAEPTTPIIHDVDLLRTTRRATRLIGREREMESLWQWLQSDKPIAVRTITGHAGAGKTRLAFELILQLLEQEPSWQAGVLPSTELRRWVRQIGAFGCVWDAPTLLVVDYAATCSEDLRILLEGLCYIPQDSPPLRILLLEREADARSIWYHSLFPSDFSGPSVQALFDPPQPIPLEPLDDLAFRRALLQETLAQATQIPCVLSDGGSAARAAITLPAPGEDPHFDKQLAQPMWGDPLYLIMAALVMIDSSFTSELVLSRTDLAQVLAHRECLRIKRFADKEHRSAQTLIAHLAACATLYGGLSKSDALALAKDEETVLAHKYPGGTGLLVEDLACALPEQEDIAPVTPDIIGEGFILEVFGHGDFALKTVVRLTRHDPTRAIATLLRAAIDYHEVSPIPLAWLNALVTEEDTGDIRTLMAIASAIPPSTQVLHPFAAKVFSALSNHKQRMAVEKRDEESLYV